MYATLMVLIVMFIVVFLMAIPVMPFVIRPVVTMFVQASALRHHDGQSHRSGQ